MADIERTKIEREFVDWYNSTTREITDGSNKRVTTINDCADKWFGQWRQDGLKVELAEAAIERIYVDIFGVEKPAIKVAESPMAILLDLARQYEEGKDGEKNFNDWAHKLGIMKYCLPFARWGVLTNSEGRFNELANFGYNLTQVLERGMRVWGTAGEGGMSDEMVQTLIGMSWCNMRDVCMVDAVLMHKPDSKYCAIVDLLEMSSWVTPLENTAYVSYNPVEVNFQDEVPNHMDDQPVMKYRDGFGVYILNGIYMPAEIVETPAEDLDVAMLDKIGNADVRREFVRKVGAERIYTEKGGKTIAEDKKQGYKLIELDFGDGTRRRYLSMDNPSVEGAVHLEGVPWSCDVCDLEDSGVNCPNRTDNGRTRDGKGCDTIKKALWYRNQLDAMPEVLT